MASSTIAELDADLPISVLFHPTIPYQAVVYQIGTAFFGTVSSLTFEERAIIFDKLPSLSLYDRAHLAESLLAFATHRARFHATADRELMVDAFRIIHRRGTRSVSVHHPLRAPLWFSAHRHSPLRQGPLRLT